MPTELIPSQSQNCTLYDLEDNLQALVDTMLSSEDVAAHDFILDQIGQSLRKAREKRDAVVAFLQHCEQQEKFADHEVARIQKRKEFIARVRTRLETHLVQVIDCFATPDRRGVKRLDGNLRGMRIQKNPDCVVINDADTLPLAWKDVTVTMPAYVWEALLQRLELEDRAVFEQEVKKKDFKPDKRAIGNELKNGEQIQGADLKFGGLRLVIE